MDKKQELPQIHKAEIVAKSRFFRVEGLQLTFSNGEERYYERMRGSGRGAVMVVPMRDEYTMLLVREYAAGTHSYELGFPKGLKDQGETPEEAANRELKEEIGYGADQLFHLKEVTTAPGYFNARMDILLGYSLYEESLEGDEPEPLEIVPWDIRNGQALLAHPEFSEARSVAALMLAKEHLEQGIRD